MGNRPGTFPTQEGLRSKPWSGVGVKVAGLIFWTSVNATFMTTQLGFVWFELEIVCVGTLSFAGGWWAWFCWGALLWVVWCKTNAQRGVEGCRCRLKLMRRHKPGPGLAQEGWRACCPNLHIMPHTGRWLFGGTFAGSHFCKEGDCFCQLHFV